MPDSLNLGSIAGRRRFSTFTGVSNILRKESSSFFPNFKIELPVPNVILEIWESARRMSRAIVQNIHFQRIVIVVIVVNTLCLALDYHDQNLFETSICRRRCEMDPNIPTSAVSNCVGPIFNRSWTFDNQGGGKRQNQSLFCFLQNDALINFPSTSLYAGGPSCSTHTDVDNCTAVQTCGWIGNECKLGLYSATTFAANATGSAPFNSISFRQLCGGANEVICRPINFPKACTCLVSLKILLLYYCLGLMCPEHRHLFVYRFRRNAQVIPLVFQMD